MNLRRIEAFLAVAEAGNISRAAIQLELAQSVVSRHISALERELGCSLFVRNGRGVGVTEAARRLAPRFKAALENMRQAAREVADDGMHPGGEVRIGLVPSAARPLVGKLYGRVAEAYPRVRLQFVEGLSDQLEDWLLGGMIDIGVLNRYGRVHRPGEQRLGVVDSFVVGPAGAFGRRAPDLGFKSLAELPLVLPARPYGLRVMLDQIAQRTGVPLRIVAEADSLLATKDLVAHGRLYTVLPHQCVHEELAAGTLSAVRLVKPGIARTIALAAAPRQEANSRATRAVLHEIRQLVVHELLPGVWRG